MSGPVEGGNGVEVLANELLTHLTEGKTFNLPVVDLSGAEFSIPAELPGVGTPDQLTNEDLTTKKIDGTGTFDVIMSSMMAHLKGEFEKNRITGEQYTKAYIALTESALSNSVQFLLQKDASYWNSITAQLQAQMAQAGVIESRVKLEIAKTQLQALRYEANIAEANYALTKIKLASEVIGYATGKYQLENMLPEQKLMLIAQREAAEENVEVARAQTLNTRKDGTLIRGVVGKQRDLYSQQITSYKRDAEVKVMKIFSDAWITMKGLDEGLLPPTPFTNSSLNGMLDDLKVRVGLGDPSAGYVPDANPDGQTIVNSTDNGDGTTTVEYSDGTFQTVQTIQP